MRAFFRSVALLAATMWIGACWAQQGAQGQEGLVEVKARQVDHAYLLPGADFRPYRKVILSGAEVAFAKNWLRDVNSNSAVRFGKVTQDQAAQIVAGMRSGFDLIWADAFKAAGWEITTSPGEDVLHVKPSVVNLYINAPDAGGASGPTRTYTVHAGEATLILDVRDSRAGTLLGRVVDRRMSTDTNRLQVTDNVTNRAQFGTLFQKWAFIAAKGLEELKANSPVPETLKPGQKIPPKS
jgi:hypothetical protein